MSQPKPDQRLIDALKRLRNSGDFQGLTKHLQDLLAHRKDMLVSSPADQVPAIQGRARELQDLLDLFAKDKP